MKAQRKPFAECPRCHNYSLRVATRTEKGRAEYHLSTEEWAVTNSDIDSYHLILCDKCGVFETFHGPDWEEWNTKFLEIIKKSYKPGKMEKLWRRINRTWRS